MLICYVQRRRAQNRVSQQAFRERKEAYILGMKKQLGTLTVKHAELTSYYMQQCQIIEQLHTRMAEINAELNTLRSAQARSLEQQTYWNNFAALDAFTSTPNPAFSQANSQPAANAMVSTSTNDPFLSHMEALVNSADYMDLQWNQ
jgi:signal transduction protein with GAF and PtsI domain